MQIRHVRTIEKIAWDGPTWGREDMFPANPDLADVLGRTDLDFENVHLLFVGSQISGCSGSQISQIWPGHLEITTAS